MESQTKRQRITTVETSSALISVPGFNEPVLVTSVGQIDELIEYLQANKPPSQKRHLLKIWKISYNALVSLCNRMVGFNRYSLIR